MSNSIGERIRECMDAYRPPLSCRGLGKKLHVTGGTISAWTTGSVTTIPDRHIAKMAKLFNKSEAWLRYGDAGTGIDEPILAQTIEGVLDSIDKSGLQVSNKKLARLVVLFYIRFHQGRAVDRDQIRQFMDVASLE